MYEICVQQMADAVAAAQRGQLPVRTGNTDPAVLLQDVYPARGHYRWVAISAFDDADLARLTALTGNRPLAEWTRDQEEADLVARLQQAGIAAGIVQDIEDLIDRDECLRARGALVDLPHAKLGRFGHVRTPISFSRDQVSPFRAPALGEHTREISLELVGLSAEKIAQLECDGVFK
jgi:crotonobetainyl-CoA:carnitine CoA-transferase CaiB-like acyl-CoA transferase